MQSFSQGYDTGKAKAEQPETPEEEDINPYMYHERNYIYKMMEDIDVATSYMPQHVRQQYG